jgi:hypothetical protein
MLKVLFIKFVPEKQSVNGEFYKEVIKRLIVRVHRVRPEFQKVGPGILCTTMHQHILQALSPSFWQNKGSPCYPVTLLPWFSARWRFLFHKWKTVMKGMRFEAISSIQQTVTRELKVIWEEAFSWAFDSLSERCKRCAEASGDYIEWWY